MIPIGFGTLRMGGNIIWAEEIRERKRTERVGKGGGGQTRTDYSYYGTWAVACSAGPAQAVLRVWGDSKLIYDAGSSGNVEVRGARVSWYRGDEEQLPDPAIEADVGAGDVPGHRGLAYVVIEDLPLEDFGNRLPSVTAEIAFAAGGGVDVVASQLAGEVGTPSSGNGSRVAVDWRRNRVFSLGEISDAAARPGEPGSHAPHGINIDLPDRSRRWPPLRHRSGPSDRAVRPGRAAYRTSAPRRA